MLGWFIPLIVVSSSVVAAFGKGDTGLGEVCGREFLAQVKYSDLNDRGQWVSRVDQFLPREWSSESQFESVLLPKNVVPNNFPLSSVYLRVISSRSRAVLTGKISNFSQILESSKVHLERAPLLEIKSNSDYYEVPLENLTRSLAGLGDGVQAIHLLVMSDDRVICSYSLPRIPGH